MTGRALPERGAWRGPRAEPLSPPPPPPPQPPPPPHGSPALPVVGPAMGLCLPCMGGAVKDVVETPDPVSAEPGAASPPSLLPPPTSLAFRPVVCKRAVTPRGTGNEPGEAAALPAGPAERWREGAAFLKMEAGPPRAAAGAPRQGLGERSPGRRSAPGGASVSPAAAVLLLRGSAAWPGQGSLPGQPAASFPRFLAHVWLLGAGVGTGGFTPCWRPRRPSF